MERSKERSKALFSYLDAHPGVRNAVIGTYMVVMCLLLVGVAWH